MQRSEFRGAKLRFGRHEIFLEEVRVLNHRALKRLENHAAFLQVFGDDIALDQLIVREDHACSVLIEAARVFQNIFAVVFRERPADLERRQIKKADIGKSPGLVFPGRLRQRLKLFPGRALLIKKPIWKFT